MNADVGMNTEEAAGVMEDAIGPVDAGARRRADLTNDRDPAGCTLVEAAAASAALAALAAAVSANCGTASSCQCTVVDDNDDASPGGPAMCRPTLGLRSACFQRMGWPLQWNGACPGRVAAGRT